MASLVGLTVADPPSRWSELGFVVDNGICRVGTVSVALGGDGTGVTGWALAAVDAAAGLSEIDGLPTEVVEDPPAPADPDSHPNGVTSLDHLVVVTPDLERTVERLGRHGMFERRRREAGRPGGPAATQVFFRLGESILELVGPPDGHGPGPARFLGLAFTVSDLDVTASVLGERLRDVKAAVQPGRFIASLDRAAGSSVEMAFLTPGR